jgi:hypothetical protein
MEKMAEVNIHSKPQPPTGCVRSIFYKVAKSELFDTLISVCVMLNVLTLCMDYYEAPTFYHNFLIVSNYVFVAIFCLEFAIKIIGLGATNYFRDNQNIFEFSLVLVSLISLASDMYGVTINITMLRILRGTRILRVFKKFTFLTNLLTQMIKSIDNLAALLTITLLMFFVFSLMAMQLFYNI